MYFGKNVADDQKRDVVNSGTIFTPSLIKTCHFVPFCWDKDYAGDVSEEYGFFSQYGKVAKLQNKVTTK